MFLRWAGNFSYTWIPATWSPPATIVIMPGISGRLSRPREATSCMRSMLPSSERFAERDNSFRSSAFAPSRSRQPAVTERSASGDRVCLYLYTGHLQHIPAVLSLMSDCSRRPPASRERDAYESAPGECDIVLTPFDHRAYSCQTSGNFIDAFFADKLCIAPRGTWMADKMNATGNGRSFHFDDFQSLEAAALDILQNHDRIRTERNMLAVAAIETIWTSPFRSRFTAVFGGRAWPVSIRGK